MNNLEQIVKNVTGFGIPRKLDELGRVVIPIEYRKGKIMDGKTKLRIYQIRDYVIIEILPDDVPCRKKFDELGRVVIFIEIRKDLNWNENDYIEIWEYKNYFILRKMQDKCIFCGKEKRNLVQYREKLICKQCKKAIESLPSY